MAAASRTVTPAVWRPWAGLGICTITAQFWAWTAELRIWFARLGTVRTGQEFGDGKARCTGGAGRRGLAIEYGERFATDHASMNDEFFQRLRAVFSDGASVC
ncbi:hypothetical protein A5647_13485 [Mycobacterium sp. 1100029.7]|nr:hypothetical protein A5647_13485 [Mycobacterium sp. 1100029.7]